MAKIGHIVICEEVLERPNDNKLSINAPLSMIVLDVLPNNYTFMASISIFDIVPEVEYDFSVKMYSPNDEEIWNFQGGFSSEADGGWAATIMNIPFRNFKFKTEGVYRIEVALTEDGQIEKSKLNFSIRKSAS